jgi:predicted O-methyltransferase YrrM
MKDKINQIIEKICSPNYQMPWKSSLIELLQKKENSQYKKYFCKGNLDGSGAMYPFMYEMIKEFKPNHVVELGNREGLGVLSMYAALEENNQGILTTVDIKKNLCLVPDHVKNSEKINFIFGDVLERNISQQIEELGVIDFIFFDTIHTCDQLKMEWNVYRQMLAKKAIILIDDLNYERPYNKSKQKFFDTLEEVDKIADKRIHTSGFGIVLVNDD